MIFQFPPAIQAGIDAHKYLQVVSNGVPLSIARDSTTGQFVGHAIGTISNGIPLNPLTSAAQLVMGAGQVYQNQRGLEMFKALSASVAALQTTTAVIGVGVAVTAALSAVNLWQTLKLGQDIEQLRYEVNEGFIDIKHILSNQGIEIIQHIDRVAEDVEFRNHRTILARAYGVFVQAVSRLQLAIGLQDLSLQMSEITAVRNMLFQALSDYENDQLLTNLCSAGKIRRRECVWAIEQAIIITLELQGEYQAVIERLSALDTKIRKDAYNAIIACDSQVELDFLFPEVTRIHDHDLAMINTWKSHIEFYKVCSPTDLNCLTKLSSSNTGALLPRSIEYDADLASDMLPEQSLYEDFKQKSHYDALRKQLEFLVQPERRRDYEIYISDQAAIVGLKALNASNLPNASHLTIANLLSYFKDGNYVKIG